MIDRFGYPAPFIGAAVTALLAHATLLLAMPETASGDADLRFTVDRKVHGIGDETVRVSVVV